MRDAVQGPLDVGKWHERVSTIVKNQRRTADGSGLQPRLADHVHPVVLNARRLLRTSKLRFGDQRDEFTRLGIVAKLKTPLSAHVLQDALWISTQLPHLPTKAESQNREKHTLIPKQRIQPPQVSGHPARRRERMTQSTLKHQGHRSCGMSCGKSGRCQTASGRAEHGDAFNVESIQKLSSEIRVLFRRSPAGEGRAVVARPIGNDQAESIFDERALQYGKNVVPRTGTMKGEDRPAIARLQHIHGPFGRLHDVATHLGLRPTGGLAVHGRFTPAPGYGVVDGLGRPVRHIGLSASTRSITIWFRSFPR